MKTPSTIGLLAFYGMYLLVYDLHALMRRKKRRSMAACIRADKSVREQLSETQIDHMVEDSFPASDPPSSY